MKIHLILLIGLTKEGAHWDDDFVESLKKKFQTDKLTLIDLPGSGSRQGDSSPISIEGIVDSTREHYKDKILADEKNILISISLGGMVGSLWVQKYPEDFQEFVIMNSSFKNLSTLPERVQPWAIKEFIGIFLTLNSEKKETRVVKLCSNNQERHSITLKKWFALAERRKMSPVNVVKQTLAGFKYSLSKKKPKARVFVIAAKKDKLASFQCSEKLVKMWGVDSHYFEEEHIGHGIHLDAPKQLADVIYNWSTK